MLEHAPPAPQAAGILKGPSCSSSVPLSCNLRCNPDRSTTTEGEQRSRSPDLLDAHEGAVRDVPSFLLFTRNAHDDHGAVASRLRADADVGRSPVVVTDREHDLRISRLERAGTAHVPRVRRSGSRSKVRLLVHFEWFAPSRFGLDCKTAFSEPAPRRFRTGILQA